MSVAEYEVEECDLAILLANLKVGQDVAPFFLGIFSAVFHRLRVTQVGAHNNDTITIRQCQPGRSKHNLRSGMCRIIVEGTLKYCFWRPFHDVALWEETPSFSRQNDSIHYPAPGAYLGETYNVYFQVRCYDSKKPPVRRNNRPLESCQDCIRRSAMTSASASYLDQFEVVGLSAFLVQAQTWSATGGKPLAVTLQMVCR
jgi:hypothetical protein